MRACGPKFNNRRLNDGLQRFHPGTAEAELGVTARPGVIFADLRAASVPTWLDNVGLVLAAFAEALRTATATSGG
jgi:hypothetical protein